MMSIIFENWVRELGSKMRNSNKKIALVDNCTTHPVLHGLANIRLVLLLPNTTAKVQPLVDVGVTRCLKAHYIKNLAEIRLLAFEEKKEFLEAMKLLKQARNSVSEMSIQNCFI